MSKSNTLSRVTLLTRAMDNLGARVISFFKSLSGDQQLAEELAQDLWVYVYKKFEPEHYQHWGFLRKKAKLLWIDKMRFLGRRPDLNFDPEAVQLKESAPIPEPSSPEEEASLFHRFWEPFEVLGFSEQQKRIFWLHERYGLTMQEVSNTLGIAKSTAHDHLKLIRAKCRHFNNLQTY